MNWIQEEKKMYKMLKTYKKGVLGLETPKVIRNEKVVSRGHHLSKQGCEDRRLELGGT